MAGPGTQAEVADVLRVDADGSIQVTRSFAGAPQIRRRRAVAGNHRIECSHIGILLVTHGTYGEALIQNVCHVLNKRPSRIAQLGVAAQDDPLDLLPLARLLLNEVDGGEGAGDDRHLRCVAVQPGDEAARTRAGGRRGGESTCRCCCGRSPIAKGMETMLSKAISGGRDGVMNMKDH